MGTEVLERVMAVPKRHLQMFRGSAVSEIFSGLKTSEPSLLKANLNDFLALGDFYERTADLERNETLVQVIAYVLLVRDGGVFVYRRCKYQGDERLRQKLSIGIGGHWKHTDGSELPEPKSYLGLKYSALRELAEEARPDRDLELVPVGLLYTPDDAVGRVHLGVVMVCQVPTDTTFTFSDGVEEELWCSPKTLNYSVLTSDRTGDVFEKWSGALIPSLESLIDPNRWPRLRSDGSEPT